jgi:uncharacterized Fe-S center protein
MSSNVYFTNLRTSFSVSLLDKLGTLIRKAGINDIDFRKKITAVKIHFGEPGNLAYIRPNFAAVVVNFLKEAGAKPFLTDANTLYSGRRANAIDHLRAAWENGFNPLTVDCPVIIADGLRGTDYAEVEINQQYCRTARIGKAIAGSDVIISMNHFKGHELTGFGGALKNLGMGCASVGGKLELHSTSAPEIYEENCTGCGTCEDNCAYSAITVGADNIAHIDIDKCTGCGQCIAVCQYDAARVVWENASELVNCKIAEYSLAVLKDKPSFHISFIMNVSPDCDCVPSNDYPLVPDIGIAASYDPVALDQACADMVAKAPALQGSRISEKNYHNHGEGTDKFRLAHPDVKWESALEHAGKIGLGTRNYKLISVH